MENAIRTPRAFGLTIMLLACVFFSGALMAQDYSKVEKQGQLQFGENKSEVASFTIDVTKGFNYLKIFVEAEIQSGDLHCEILDPKGKVIREINLESTVNTGNHQNFNSQMKGEMQKAIRLPEKGKWEIRLTPTKAVAFVRVEHMLAFHPKVDVLELEQIEADLE